MNEYCCISDDVKLGECQAVKIINLYGCTIVTHEDGSFVEVQKNAP